MLVVFLRNQKRNGAHARLMVICEPPKSAGYERTGYVAATLCSADDSLLSEKHQAMRLDSEILEPRLAFAVTRNAQFGCDVIYKWLTKA